MKRSFVGLVTIAMTMTPLGVAAQNSPEDAPVTPATAIHGAPGNTPGFGGRSANPAGTGTGKNGGAGIHNIGAAPGQGGATQGGGSRGGPSNDMHGGLDETTGRW